MRLLHRQMMRLLRGHVLLVLPRLCLLHQHLLLLRVRTIRLHHLLLHMGWEAYPLLRGLQLCHVLRIHCASLLTWMHTSHLLLPRHHLPLPQHLPLRFHHRWRHVLRHPGLLLVHHLSSLRGQVLHSVGGRASR